VQDTGLPASIEPDRRTQWHPGTATRPRILVPGRNCWRVARARRAAVLVDAADYYAQLDRALRSAEHSILIVGWDFDGRIKLRPDDSECVALGDLLRSLVEARPQLHIRILVWSVAVLHAPGAPLPLLLGAPWQDHPRISLRLDSQHPLYAAHHQKIVCIDDEIAYVGGIDLTVKRWDTCDHGSEDPLRSDPDGLPYHPIHDIQMVVTGEIAREISAVARSRWHVATGEDVAPVDVERQFGPTDCDTDFTDVPVGIARTAPAWRGAHAIREVAALTIDAIASARHRIYIESQYFTARELFDVTARGLGAREGPEIVVIVTRAARGFIERHVMGKNRNRLMRRLKRADRYDRLRVYYPVVPTPAGDCEVLVHAKLMIVDDDFLRIGSANLNNRSMGLDTECDLALEAKTDAARRTIARLRDRLLAEHTDTTPSEVAAATAGQGTLIRGIESLNCNDRCLRPLLPDNRGPTRWVFGTRLLDPVRPFEPLWFLHWRSSSGRST
jgi:phosphatidylserine/phosphatidylglycerophosphate/cardiolipin synthase-like enzyme